MSKVFEALAALAAVGTFIVTFLDSYEIKFRIRRRARTVRDGRHRLIYRDIVPVGVRREDEDREPVG